MSEERCIDCGSPAGSAAGPIITHLHLPWHEVCFERRLRDDGDLVSVQLLLSDASIERVGKILHEFGCVPGCELNPSGWNENARIALHAALGREDKG